MTANSTINPAHLFATLYGKPAWGFRHAHGSHIMIEFGSPVREVALRSGSTFRCGEAGLLVLSADWLIMDHQGSKVSCNDPPQQIAEALSKLEATRLRGAVFDTERQHLTIAFENEMKLYLARSSSPDTPKNEDIWSLHLLDGSHVGWAQGGWENR